MADTADPTMPAVGQRRWRCLLLWTSPISRPLVDALRRAGVDVYVTVDAGSCLARLRFAAWDVCLIDEKVSGARDVADRVRAEQIGVETHLVRGSGRRPLDLVELVLAALGNAGDTPRRGAAIEVGDLVIDPGRHDAYFAGQGLDLQRAEFRLLYLLATHQGPVHRSELARQLGAELEEPGRRIDLLVSRVRRKLMQHSGRECIATVRGYGYAFEFDEVPSARPRPEMPRVG